MPRACYVPAVLPSVSKGVARAGYPSDVSDDEWAFLAPYLALVREDAPQRAHSLRELLDGLRYVARSGAPWRMMPRDLPPWHAVYQQTRRWLAAGCFEQAAHDLRELVRLKEGKNARPTAAILDGRVLRSTPESGHRAGYNGHKRTKGSKVHLAVDTLGLLLAIVVTPASVDGARPSRSSSARSRRRRARASSSRTSTRATRARRYAEAAAKEGVRLEVVSLPEAKRGFVLLPRRWVVERSFAWSARFKRLAKDYERLPEVLAGFHAAIFCALMLKALAPWLQGA